MKRHLLLCLLTLLTSFALKAQIVNNGGGMDEIDAKSKLLLTPPDFKSERRLKEDADKFIKLAKKKWKSCYNTKAAFKNMIELHQVLSIEKSSAKLTEGTAPRACPTAEMQCLMSHKQISNDLKLLVENKNFLRFLKNEYDLKNSEARAIQDFFIEINPTNAQVE